MNISVLLNAFILLIGTIFLNNCSHYSVISTDEAPFKSLYIHNISNQDFSPNVQILFQAQLKQTILQDNRLLVVNDPNEADTQLYITIKKYNREVYTRSGNDPGRFNSLNLELIVFISLYDNSTNTFLLDNVLLDSKEHLFFDPNKNLVLQKEREYEILPKITRSLSQNILELVLSDWPVPKD